IDALFGELKQAGVGYVLVDSLNLCGAARGRVTKVLEAHYPDLVTDYVALARDRQPYHDALMARTRAINARRGLAWRGANSGN
ncbi:MAG: hypothetical protein KKB13_06340, partial [Chloroflexi bacterium]|nr:hypothetical protein [Chloroflexota bacterium]